MKKKSKQLEKFINGLHEFIVTNPQFRQDTKKKAESVIQGEIRPLIIRYLEKHFKARYKDHVAKANKSFYWEGQEGKFGRARATTFGSRNYPDFIITEPYLIALEYKQSSSGALVKQAIGQSMMHTLTGDFDYVYVLFHDENKDKRIQNSQNDSTERMIIDKVWKEFNVYLKFV